MFLHPARRGGQLDVRTDARAARILFDGTRATGVRYVDDRNRATVREVFARKEVIVSSGTANTAKLLQMSGVGPAGCCTTLACRSSPICRWARISATITRCASWRG